MIYVLACAVLLLLCLLALVNARAERILAQEVCDEVADMLDALHDAQAAAEKPAAEVVLLYGREVGQA